MRSKADRIIMLRSAEPERSRADFLEDFHESGDSGLFLSRRCADQRVSIAPKEVGVGVRDDGEFLRRHGMTAKEERPIVRRKPFFRSLRNAHFGAASIRDQGMSRSVPRNFRKEINGGGNGQSNVNQVGILQRGSEVAGKGFVDGYARLRFAGDFGTIPADNANVRGVFVERQTEGPANQASAQNRDSRDDVA